MKLHFTRILAVVCLTLGILSTLSMLNAAEPRMEKAIQLLQQAQTSPNPVPQLEKAIDHLQNATGNKGGFKVNAIQTIKQAIKTAQRGGNARPQIGQAIAQVQAGINAK